MSSVFDVIRCPSCGARLERGNGTLACSSEGKKHTFDVASSGYVNLLPPGRKNNAVTGDRRDLLKARGAFLDSGLYAPVSDAVAASAATLAPGAGEFVFADFGCGEGYHTCRVAESLSKKISRVVAVGVDASKYAAEAGAKRAKRLGFPSPFAVEEDGGSTVAFIAGNFFRPPFFSTSLSCVITMFAPVAYGAAHGALRDGGGVVAAIPGPDHLIELREMIYRDVRRKEGALSVPDSFSVKEKTAVRYPVRLTGEQTADLFGMTPFFCRAPEEIREKILSAGETEVTVDVDIYTIAKR